MKKSKIIGIASIAVAIVALIVLSGDYDTYQPFSHAFENPGKKVQIIGHLSKDKEIYYNPEKDPNYFSFFMTDDEGVEQKIIFKEAKPQGLEHSEKIVLTGKYKEGKFVASHMLTKCPSKYKDEEIKLRAKI